MSDVHSSHDGSAKVKGKSNKRKGDENLERLKRWLAAAERIPDRNGAANVSAIAVASGVDRQVLYRPEARRMIAEAVEAKGLGMPDQVPVRGDEVPQWAKARMHEMEQRLATLYAELGDLRKKLARYEHIERHMTATGMLPR